MWLKVSWMKACAGHAQEWGANAGNRSRSIEMDRSEQHLPFSWWEVCIRKRPRHNNLNDIKSSAHSGHMTEWIGKKKKNPANRLIPQALPSSKMHVKMQDSFHFDIWKPYLFSSVYIQLCRGSVSPNKTETMEWFEFEASGQAGQTLVAILTVFSTWKPGAAVILSLSQIILATQHLMSLARFVIDGPLAQTRWIRRWMMDALNYRFLLVGWENTTITTKSSDLFSPN